MESSKRILITGASGFLGYTLAQHAKGHHTVYGSQHKYPLRLEGVSSVNANLGDFRDVRKLIHGTQPELIFHLAAMSNPNQCEQNPELSYDVNVSITRYMAKAAEETGARLIFTSSDLVFDGSKAPYDENDIPAPINRYGRQKAEAEKAVLDYARGTVCRMPLMFGVKSPTSGSFLQPMIQFLLANQNLNLFVDEIRTPLSADKAAEGLLLMAEKEPSLVHLAGDQAIDRYDFGLLLCDLLGAPIDLLIKRNLSDISFDASRPANTSMKNDRAKALGFDPGNLQQELEKVVAQENERHT
jgi:dTDP-4-dehydrorhamnose reductase